MENEKKVNMFSGFSEEGEVIEKEDVGAAGEKAEGSAASQENQKAEGSAASQENQKAVEKVEEKQPEKGEENQEGKGKGPLKSEMEDGEEALEFTEDDFNFKLETTEAESKNVDKPIDYVQDAKELGLDIEGEGDASGLSREQFIQKVNEKIEASKQQFSYQNIPEDTKDIVKFFAEEGGSVADLLNDNDVVLASTLLAMNDKDKFLIQKSQTFINAGLSREEARERASDIYDSMSEEEVAKAVKFIDMELVAYKKDSINKIVNLRKTLEAKKQHDALQKAIGQKKEIISVVKSTEQFMGMKLTPEVKEKIIEHIDSGEFEKVLSSSLPKAKLDAYLLKVFGKQIYEMQEKIQKRIRSESYNKGIAKYIEKNHNVKPEHRETEISTKGGKQKWSGFAELE